MLMYEPNWISRQSLPYENFFRKYTTTTTHHQQHDNHNHTNNNNNERESAHLHNLLLYSSSHKSSKCKGRSMFEIQEKMCVAFAHQVTAAAIKCRVGEGAPSAPVTCNNSVLQHPCCAGGRLGQCGSQREMDQPISSRVHGAHAVLRRAIESAVFRCACVRVCVIASSWQRSIVPLTVNERKPLHWLVAC
jgi:hypothetical protein